MELGAADPAGLCGKEPGWQELPSPTWCCSFEAGLGSLAGPLPPQAKLPSVGTGLATLLSVPPGISPPSSLCPQPVWGGDRAALAASGRNPSDRGCGEGRVGLAYETRAVPESCPRGAGGPSPSRVGARAAWGQGCHSRGPPHTLPTPVVPAPAPLPGLALGSRTAGSGLRTAISHIGRHFPGWVLARPSAGPVPGPPEGGPGRPGLAPAILRHGQVGTPRAPGLPLGGAHLGRSVVRTFHWWELRLKAAWSLGLLGPTLPGGALPAGTQHKACRAQCTPKLAEGTAS